MEDFNKIVNKIRKILELSKNNPSKEEAKSAALKAQKLMAEYHVSMSEVGEIETKGIVEKEEGIKSNKRWRIWLANVISDNFRCKVYQGIWKEVIFYGYFADVTIALETYKALYEIGNEQANRYYIELEQRAYEKGEIFYGAGVKNNFLYGYCQGIREVLEKQSKELVIITPPEVEEAFKKYTRSMGMISCGGVQKSYYKTEAIKAGQAAGREAASNRQIEKKE